MITDITLGQYFPIESVIHKIDPRAKILFTIVYIVLVFLADSPITYGLIAFFCISVILLSKISFSVVIKSVKPMFFVILITAIINFSRFYKRFRDFGLKNLGQKSVDKV